jgi:hypothetical protein
VLVIVGDVLVVVDTTIREVGSLYKLHACAVWSIEVGRRSAPYDITVGYTALLILDMNASAIVGKEAINSSLGLDAS